MLLRGGELGDIQQTTTHPRITRVRVRVRARVRSKSGREDRGSREGVSDELIAHPSLQGGGRISGGDAGRCARGSGAR